MKHEVATSETMAVNVKRGSFSILSKNGIWYRVALPGMGRTLAYKAFGALLAGTCVDNCAEPAELEFGPSVVGFLKSMGLGIGQDFQLVEGNYLGSRYVANPRSQAIYDLLPPGLMSQVSNRAIFSVARGVDVWLGNTDPNHAVFVRQTQRDFRAHMVGFGQVFRFSERARPLFSHERAEFDTKDSWAQTMMGVERLNHLTDSRLLDLASAVPANWWATADRPVTQIIDQLLHRRDQLPSILAAIRRPVEGDVTRKSPKRVEFIGRVQTNVS